ncbi:hypothetical protein FRC07_007698 [Ceratobasidium sp. 392]|nr:hypothetical protein FRC07_007698 [Ceratobasidium sp. 392]
MDLFKQGLIPAKLTRRNDEIHVHIAKSLTPKNMARFWIHAPYIKGFRFSSRTADICDWESLEIYAKKKELLPNLIDFHCSPVDLEVVSVFLSRSTKCITTQEKHCSKTSAGLIIAAARTCPGLCSLEFYPQPHEQGTSQLLYIFDFVCLSAFKSLRTLISTPVILQDAILQVVAQLPELSRLVIQDFGIATEWNPPLRTKLSGDYNFPALEDLSIPFANSRDIKKFWELVPLSKLETLLLNIHDVGPGKNPQDFIKTICQASPLIENLQLLFPEVDPADEDEEPFAITEATFEYMAELPLDEIFILHHAMLDFDDAWVAVVCAWDGLTRIECLHQPTTLEDLIFLSSKLPNLKTIKCDLDLEDEAPGIKHNWVPDGQPFYPSLTSLVVKRFELKDIVTSLRYTLSDTARYLAYFWPNARVESVQENLLEYYSSDDESDTEERDKYILFKLLRELIRAYICLFHNRDAAAKCT